MKKDIEWLREEIYALYPSSYRAYVLKEPDMLLKTEIVDKIIELIDQLEEPTKPVIPKFVAEWIEVSKKHYSIGAVFHDAYDGKLAKVAIEEYIFENQDLFAQAWLDGYEVEKEKKYYVAFEDINLLYVTRVEVCGENEKLNYSSESSTENAMKFIDKEKASSLAYFLGAIVVEATQ